eukprot:TRINITY_DN3382_c0_g2_i2.p1 TRINITY_DN3382_c0_g2~~TRINITY_DN3382_c0_g2_i2.p1  ORF type:complete len:259 (-),score=41.53 TRINITY_DN3382_c0_g2_i2:835-1611(-)
MAGLRYVFGGVGGNVMLSSLVSMKSSRSFALVPLQLPSRAAARNCLSAVRGIQAAAMDTLAYDRNETTTGMGGRRVFVQHSFYKKNSALCFRPIAATFRLVDGGSNAALARQGALLLEFAKAVGERQYDWQKKQTFSLSVAELGVLISTRPSDGQPLNFFHDPMKGRIGEGVISKSFRIDLAKDGGYFFNLVVKERGVEKEKVSIPVSIPEFAILCSTANFLLPHLMGWSAFAVPSSLDDAVFVSGESTPLDAEEWAE